MKCLEYIDILELRKSVEHTYNLTNSTLYIYVFIIIKTRL